MSVRDNLSEGKYQPKLQYPAHSGTTREEYLKLRKEYGEESSRLLTEFKADLEDEFGVAGNPITELSQKVTTNMDDRHDIDSAAGRLAEIAVF